MAINLKVTEAQISDATDLLTGHFVWEVRLMSLRIHPVAYLELK